jgi:hypothetical protein
MDKMLVAVFESESQATAAAGAMKDRCDDSALLVYALAVIVRDVWGISVVDFTREKDRSHRALGIATRSLIELLDEPNHAVDHGNSDAITGAMMKMARTGVDAFFLDEVARHLLPGKAAIVAEIEEMTATKIDILLESQGGIVFAYVRRENMDAEIARELDALCSEIQNLESQLLRTADGSKAQLQEKMDLTKARFEATKERASQIAASIRREAEAKIVWLQERAATASGGIKAKIEGLAGAIRVDYVNRATKLNLAWQFAGDVFAGCARSSRLE